eukprot:gb/GFBE01082775.1/.p1 GENE.gb/GFBE01082775.1/~~gb/GFBE01082775.1/.p1  ORF type:complete len:173 (+),score=19.05 gb/GFBE01082775.1/:1-519(+)
MHATMHQGYVSASASDGFMAQNMQGNNVGFLATTPVWMYSQEPPPITTAFHMSPATDFDPLKTVNSEIRTRTPSPEPRIHEGFANLAINPPPTPDFFWTRDANFQRKSLCLAQCIELPGPASQGSIGHPFNCAEPCKFANKARGCKDGNACTHCHLCKWNRYRNARTRDATR